MSNSKRRDIFTEVAATDNECEDKDDRFDVNDISADPLRYITPSLY